VVEKQTGKKTKKHIKEKKITDSGTIEFKP
jgi:hypothetical protein